jgi:hypothetical protein
MRGSIAASPVLLALFLGWSLLTSLRERLGARPPSPRGPSRRPVGRSGTGSPPVTGTPTRGAVPPDPRTWLN